MTSAHSELGTGPIVIVVLHLRARIGVKIWYARASVSSAVAVCVWVLIVEFDVWCGAVEVGFRHVVGTVGCRASFGVYGEHVSWYDLVWSVTFGLTGDIFGWGAVYDDSCGGH